MVKNIRSLTLLISLVLQCNLAVATPQVSETSLPLKLALALVDAALEVCSEGGYKISVAVVGNAGRLKAQATADGAYLHSDEITLRKAYAAVSLSRPTYQAQQQMMSDSNHNSAFNLSTLGMTALGGGVPITQQGLVVGAIAVSGAQSAKNSADCAERALKLVSID